MLVTWFHAYKSPCVSSQLYDMEASKLMHKCMRMVKIHNLKILLLSFGSNSLVACFFERMKATVLHVTWLVDIQATTRNSDHTNNTNICTSNYECYSHGSKTINYIFLQISPQNTVEPFCTSSLTYERLSVGSLFIWLDAQNFVIVRFRLLGYRHSCSAQCSNIAHQRWIEREREKMSEKGGYNQMLSYISIQFYGKHNAA